MYDILIKNGKIIDGTGKPAVKADLAVNKDEIAKIGDLSSARGDVEIDAAGKAVTPGFIDIHNHSDAYWRLFLEPQLPSLVYQGITTVIGGNCGTSIAPLTGAKIIESIQKWADIREVNVDWLSMRELSEKLGLKKLGLNFGTLVGHGTLRRGIMLDEMRRLNRNEIEVFKNNLEKSLRDGALGFSTGLAYSHEKPAIWDELVEFAGMVKAEEKLYSTHLRNEAGGLIEALQEAIELAKETGVRTQISHFKVMGEKNWSLMDQALENVSRASEEGFDIHFDVYPYTETGSVLYVFLPTWAAEGGKKMLLRRLKEEHLRDTIIHEMKESAQYHYEDAIIAIGSVSKSLTRRKISEIAREQGISVEEAIVDLLIASEGRVITIADVLSEENVRKVISHPLSIIASDGAGYGLEHKKSGELVHPRCFGTFPKVFRKYVREEKVLSLEEAVKKMTSMPAEKMGFQERGVLKKGYKADISIFDPEKITDRSTVEDPYQYSEGVRNVIVNGKVVLQNGKMTGEMAGEFLSA